MNMKLGSRCVLVPATLLMLVSTASHASTTLSALSEANFKNAAANGSFAAYAAFQVGDSLSPDFPYFSTGEPELSIGKTPSEISQTAQFDWPANWMQSYFTLSFSKISNTLSLSLHSSEPNGWPSFASVSLLNVGNFDTINVASTANSAAMYIGPLVINGNALPALSPNGYGSGASTFQGFQVSGDVLNSDFNVSGAVYFDGGYQRGSSNRLEFSLAQVTAVPEPETYTLMMAGLGLLCSVVPIPHRQKNRS